MSEPTTWLQVDPDWCPYIYCQFRCRVMDHMCIGELPEPAPHDGDFNTHRLCLTGVFPDDKIFDLQINKSDVGWFRFLFDAIFPQEINNRQAD